MLILYLDQKFKENDPHRIYFLLIRLQVLVFSTNSSLGLISFDKVPVSGPGPGVSWESHKTQVLATGGCTIGAPYQQEVPLRVL